MLSLCFIVLVSAAQNATHKNGTAGSKGNVVKHSRALQDSQDQTSQQAAAQNDAGAADEILEEPEEEEDAALPHFYEQRWPVDGATDSLRKHEAFAYMAYIDSVLRNPPKLVEEPVATKPSGPGFFSQPMVKAILWILALVGVGFVLYQFLFGGGALFMRKPKLRAASMQEEEDVPGNAAGYYNLAQQAAAQGQYRLATRYWYLYSLQGLEEKGLLQQLPSKTNWHYQQELKSHACAPAFASLLLQYEYVWYGGFALNAEQYQQLEGSFKQFTNQWA